MSHSVYIEGRTWFDKSGGNSYWATRIWVDGAVIVQLPMTYGYGDQYVQDSIKWLVDNGYLPIHNHPSDLRKLNIHVYRSLQTTLKRDLFPAWTAYQN